LSLIQVPRRLGFIPQKDSLGSCENEKSPKARIQARLGFQ